ncbi:hypothetical protein EI94DRAFT_1291789 [Lactarius quietus]|nr:hypothetical protein EI94DRAFT_1291789 [Lactarius quietus]
MMNLACAHSMQQSSSTLEQLILHRYEENHRSYSVAPLNSPHHVNSRLTKYNRPVMRSPSISSTPTPQPSIMAITLPWSHILAWVHLLHLLRLSHPASFSPSRLIDLISGFGREWPEDNLSNFTVVSVSKHGQIKVVLTPNSGSGLSLAVITLFFLYRTPRSRVNEPYIERRLSAPLRAQPPQPSV